MKKSTITIIALAASLTVIVGFVIFLGLGTYLSKAKSASTVITEHNTNVETVDRSIDAVLGNTSAGYGEYAEAAPDAVDPNLTNPTIIDPTKGRLLIRTVDMTAETVNFITVENDIKAKTIAAGGYMEYSSVSGTGKDRNLRVGNYVIRVPADKLDELISSVGSNCTITYSSESTTDVTLQYVDTTARLESLQIEYEQLLDLLEKADDLDNIFLLQNRLTEVRYEIESTKSTLLVLENQVQYATLSLTLQEVLEESEIVEPHVITFSEKITQQFEAMKENTKVFFQGLVLWVISALPGLIFILVNAIILILIISSVRKKKRMAAERIKAAEASANNVKDESKS